jgi:LmbE family N-acetylglucosaminyl deacetylase
MARYAAQRDADLIYMIRGLQMGGAVLHLGAHPDDEETGLMAYLSRGRAVRTVYWSATRGEGGQNRLGSEVEEALGVLRTWESLAAREIDGAEVLYGPFYDFGFSKSADDAFARWDRDELVGEIVRAIRLVQPDVVISRWSGGGRDGHGQHQAVGLAALEAFDTAADPERFPQLGLPPWQPLKLYRSTVGDRQPGEDLERAVRVLEDEEAELLRVDVGQFDPVAGRTYGELAAIALNRHRTQAMATLPERGQLTYYYRLVETRVAVQAPETDFFDGLDPSVVGLTRHAGGGVDALGPLLDRARERARSAAAGFHPDERAATGLLVLEGLAAIRQARQAVLDPASPSGRAVEAYLARRERCFEEAAARLLGLGLECQVDRSRVTPGEDIRLTVRLWNESSHPLDQVTADLKLPEGWSADRLEPVSEPGGGPVLELGFRLTVPDTAALSSPYWLREPRAAYRYAWPGDGSLGQPVDEPQVSAVCEVQIGAERLTVSAPAVHRESFGGGYRELPLEVLPPVMLEPQEEREFVSHAAGDLLLSERLSLHVTARCARRDGAVGTLEVTAPTGWRVAAPEQEVAFGRQGESRSLPVEVHVPATAEPGNHEISYRMSVGARSDSVVLRPVRQLAPGLPGPANEANCVAEVFMTAPATVAVHLVDARFERDQRYGYVPGMEEDTARVLARLGLNVSVLTEEQLTFDDLDAFDVIAVGPHAYLLRPHVRRNGARLLEYVERGGTLIVQLQGYDYQAGSFAPYPFSYHQPHDRVTLPDAPVIALEPDHPILNLPNRIEPADFEGWVHDRGLYFFGDWDDRYTSVIASNDPGEDPKAGGLLVAGHGRGTYVYTGYSFFRQIPAGVPGALRLSANLLALPEARIRERAELVRAVPLFSFMDDEQLRDAARQLSERHVRDGEYLCRQGEPGTELYVVMDGNLEVIQEAECDLRGLCGPGAVLGEVAILADTPRSASLRARGDVKLLAMSGSSFREMLHSHPDLTDRILEIVSRRLLERERAGMPSGSD